MIRAVAKLGAIRLEDLSSVSSGILSAILEGPEKMNENMDAKEPVTDVSCENAAESPTGAKLGAGHVFQVFRQNKLSLTAVICLSIMMEIALVFIFMIIEYQIRIYLS